MGGTLMIVGVIIVLTGFGRFLESMDEKRVKLLLETIMVGILLFAVGFFIM